MHCPKEISLVKFSDKRSPGNELLVAVGAADAVHDRS
jgi:hypothetical protein